MYGSTALFIILAIVFAIASGRPLPSESDHRDVRYRMHHRGLNVPTVHQPEHRRRALRLYSGSISCFTPTDILGDLFPVGDSVAVWTTSTQSDLALPLSDDTFRPHDVLKALGINFVTAPDGEKSIQAIYPAGSYTFTHSSIIGGFSFFAPGPASVDLTLAKEATFGYSTYFPEGFQFQKGGKVPGLYGGNTAVDSINCSGGTASSHSGKCFSARLMWRTDGAGELYLYLPPSDIPRFAPNRAICNIKPVSVCSSKYGASVGRGAFTFATGARTYVSQRVRLNDVDQANGEIELFVNGKSVISATGLILRDSEDGKIRGLEMQTFFGGSTPDYASPQTQSAYFSDMSVAITELL